MAAAWSPDGKSIAFVSNADFEQGEIYIVPTEGGDPRKVLDRSFGVGYPSWSADSRFIVTPSFKPYSTRYREGMNYYTLVPSVSGPARTIVPAQHLPIGKRAGDGPAWSPDGKQIAFVTNEYLYVMPVTPGGRSGRPAASADARARRLDQLGRPESDPVHRDRSFEARERRQRTRRRTSRST